MFGLTKKIFIGLFISIAKLSNHTKCVSLRNQKCTIKPTLINSHPNEYSQEFPYCPFAIKLDRCVGSCNTLNDLSNKICLPKKTEDLNLSICNMITGINESKTLTKHILCECECRFDGRKCNSVQWWNNNKCQCQCEKCHVCDYVLNPATCKCANRKYLASIMDDSLITFDEVIGADVDTESKLNDQAKSNNESKVKILMKKSSL